MKQPCPTTPIYHPSYYGWSWLFAEFPPVLAGLCQVLAAETRYRGGMEYLDRFAPTIAESHHGGQESLLSHY